MLTDLQTIAKNTEFQSDICIIGAGVAGQTLAMRLAKSNVKVLLVESGGRDFKAKTQALAKGTNIGEDYYDLETTRLRLFGGTAAIWGGRCAELDPIDFIKRDYIPHSGWPFLKSELDPYYKTAFQSLGLKRPGEGRLWKILDKTPPPFLSDRLESDWWCFDEDGERFTNTSRGNLDDVHTVLNATVTNLDLGEQGEIKSAKLTTIDGRHHSARAKVFVIAAGAVESVRLLMAAVIKRPKGLGNDHDQLGRYFMEHPHARGGRIIPYSLGQSLSVLPRAIRVHGQRYAAYMRPSESLQMERGVLNTSLSFAPRRHADGQMELFRSVTGKLKHDLPSTKMWRGLYKSLKGAAIRGLEWTDPWLSVANMKLSRGKLGLYAVIRAEQAPNPDSRVTLAANKDSLGVPRAALDWRFSDLDKRSVKELMSVLAEEYERLNWGEVIPSEWLSDDESAWVSDPNISSHPIGGYHHMGGIRMGDDISTSVVDKNCKLHESPNTYIAGSAVFPTSGWANPTVTIMALAERLGDHLCNKMVNN